MILLALRFGFYTVLSWGYVEGRRRGDSGLLVYLESFGKIRCVASITEAGLKKTARPLVFTIEGLSPHFGGPSRSVPSLVAALKSTGAAVELITFRKFGDVNRRQASLIWFFVDLLNLSLFLGEFVKLRFFRARGMRPVLCDIGLWRPNNALATLFAWIFSIDIVIFPKGMLADWALGRSSSVKMVYLRILRLLLSSRLRLAAASTKELDEIKRVFPNNEVLYIPNPVCAPEIDYCTEKKRETVVFLGRIHPVKRLKELILAVSSVAHRYPLLKVELYGPDEGEHLAVLLSMVSDLGLADRIMYMGVLDDSSKWYVLESSGFLYNCSFTENFGNSIAEAMASGTPVIISSNTGWGDVGWFDGGLIIGEEVFDLENALISCLEMSDKRYDEVSSAARGLAQRFSPSIVGELAFHALCNISVGDLSW